MREFHELGILELATAIRDRSVSLLEMTQSLLSRAKTLEPKLHVWVTLDNDSVLEQAHARESDLKQNVAPGPLHGVPIGIKDIFYTKDIRTTACSPLYENFIPDFDSTAVTLLKNDGALIMGKTVTTEWACMDPPPTLNPWNANHTPGGSSSGSAVGVAARIFPGALGSQTAGSVIRPAAYNGIIGLKPSFGLISRYGVFPAAWSLDTMGLFTRTVEDSALLLQTLSRHDAKDFSSTDLPSRISIPNKGTNPPKIGILETFFYEDCSDEVRSHTLRIVEQLRKAGAEIYKINLPANFDALLAAHRIVMTVELATIHAADFDKTPDSFGPGVRGFIEAGILTPAVHYVQAQRIRRGFRKQIDHLLKTLDVLLTPSTPTPAPKTLTSTGDPKFQTPWTTSGLPSITLPSGLSETGLPLGIQLVSGWLEEETLLKSAQWCEETMKVELKPPSIP